MTSFYGSVQRAGGAAVKADIDIVETSMEDNSDPVVTLFTRKHTMSVASDGSTVIQHPYDPPKVFQGPGILKIQATASAADCDVSAGFDGYVVKN